MAVLPKTPLTAQQIYDLYHKPPEESKQRLHPPVLAEAERITTGERRETYGEPTVNHGRTAALWSHYLGRTITARDVCILNILQKISRDAHRPTHDNLIDIAGYAANAGEL